MPCALYINGIIFKWVRSQNLIQTWYVGIRNQGEKCNAYFNVQLLGLFWGFRKYREWFISGHVNERGGSNCQHRRRRINQRRAIHICSELHCEKHILVVLLSQYGVLNYPGWRYRNDLMGSHVPYMERVAAKKELRTCSW